jgi:hypothetical protein
VYKKGAGRGKESGENKTRPASKGPPDPVVLYDCEYAQVQERDDHPVKTRAKSLCFLRELSVAPSMR